MVSPTGRRKVRKRKAQVENSRVKLGIIIGIMLLAIFFGFLTARFVIGPIIGYNADESPIKQADDQDAQKDNEDGEDNKDENANTDVDADSGKDSDEEAADSKDDEGDTEVSATPTEGYALQFGAFSTKDAAQKLADQLKEKGIETKVVEVDKVFKVISPIVDTKSDALDALEKVKEKEVTDVFVASF